MMKIKKQRVLLIGLDGVTWRLLTPMINEGLLPNLKRLCIEGASGDLESTIPPVTAPAWTTFQTGVLPGKHGVYDFNQYRPGSYRTTFVNSQDIQLPTLWELASQAGKRVVVVNVPLTYPPREVNGFLITGMQTPNLQANFTYPAELGNELLQVVPDYQIIVPQTEFNLKGLDAFVDASIDAERARFRAFRYLLAEKCPDWDLAMVHVQSTDTVQHAIYCWLDPTDSRFSHECHDRAVRFYQVIDEQVGALLNDVADDDTLAIVLSDHGHGSIYKTINVNAYLNQAGFLTLQGQGKRISRTGWLRRSLKLLLRLDRWNLNKALLPKQIRRPLLERLSGGMLIDWERTQAYMINGWVYAHLYLNLKDREPYGIIDSGDYDDVRTRVANAMEQLRDPETGQRIVRDIYHREHIFSGPYLQTAPDLVIEPIQGYEFSASLFQETETIVRPNRVGRDHTGSHSLDGIVALAGSMVAHQESVAGTRLVDLFPTILAWLGVPIPSYVDGHVLHDVFSEEVQGKLVIEWNDGSDIGGPTESQAQVFSEDEADQIEERLRSLGYM